MTKPQQRVAALLRAIDDLKDDDLIEVLKLDEIVQLGGERHIKNHIDLATRAMRDERGAGRGLDRIWRVVLNDISLRAERVKSGGSAGRRTRRSS